MVLVWRPPRSVMAAAAMLAGAALAGCALPAEPPPVAVVSPPPLVTPAPVAVAQPRPSLSPPIGVPEPPAPTVRHTPLRPSATPPESRETPPPATPTPSRPPSPSPTPSASPTPEPTSLVALLPRAAALAPLEWADATGAHTAPWVEVAPPGAIAPGVALPHVAAARSATGGCASAADAVDGEALEAASTTLHADPAPGAPVDLVVVRYPSEAAAQAAVAAIQALGAACEGVVTPDGTLGSGVPTLAAAAVLSGDGAALVVDAAADGAILIAVVHEGAPTEAVTALVRAQVAALV